MRYEIVLTDAARRHFDALDARWRAVVKKGLEVHLRHEPMKTSRSRIKRLREMNHPEYRLRLDPYRIFYDVLADRVLILAIVPEDGTAQWLDEYGVKET